MLAQQTRNLTLPIALTMGDPAGISTEITALAWKQRRALDLPPFFVISRKSLFEEYTSVSGQKLALKVIRSPDEAIEVFTDALPVLELPENISVRMGVAEPKTGMMTVRSIEMAVDFVHTKSASSVVTNPINKHVLYQAGFAFPGHTEYLANLAEKWGEESVKPVMMLASSELRTVPLTVHIPLEDVAKNISFDLIVETARILSNDLKKFFRLQSPRLAVAGLNPHAGENGAMGRAEIDIIEPAIKSLRSEGVNITGPHPADTLFHAAARKNYDVVIGMYHDQALIPIKTLGFDEGVNTTLGLPFVRTSPDHGTAYDIAGKNMANPTSLIEAIKMAHSMSDCSLEQMVND